MTPRLRPYQVAIVTSFYLQRRPPLKIKTGNNRQIQYGLGLSGKAKSPSNRHFTLHLLIVFDLGCKSIMKISLCVIYDCRVWAGNLGPSGNLGPPLGGLPK